MKKYLTLLVVLLSLVLAGCHTAPEIKYVTQYDTVTVVIEPPRELYSKQPRVKPPNIDLYTKANVDDKEAILFNHIEELNKHITKLLLDRAATDSWIVKQKKIVEDQIAKQKEENKKKKDKP